MAEAKGSSLCANLEDGSGITLTEVCARTLVTLSTGGGVHAVTVSAINAGDIGFVELVSQDTGTTITSLICAITDNTITITRTDDSSSQDDATAYYWVYRPTVTGL